MVGSGEEDPLLTRTIRRIAHFTDLEPMPAQIILDLSALPKAQGGHRFQRFAGAAAPSAAVCAVSRQSG